VEPRKLDVGGFCNGILAGLVAITGPCAVVKPWEAIIIGFVGGIFYQAISMLMRRARIDDVVDAVAVHGACGLWGVIALGLFGNPDEGIGGNGVLYGGDQLGVQLFAAVLIIAWTACLSLLLFVPLRFMGMLRLSDGFQDAGADAMEHSPRKPYSDIAQAQQLQPATAENGNGDVEINV
jgi:Amt family ammonium transporter